MASSWRCRFARVWLVGIAVTAMASGCVGVQKYASGWPRGCKTIVFFAQPDQYAIEGSGMEIPVPQNEFSQSVAGRVKAQLVETMTQKGYAAELAPRDRRSNVFTVLGIMSPARPPFVGHDTFNAIIQEARSANAKVVLIYTFRLVCARRVLPAFQDEPKFLSLEFGLYDVESGEKAMQAVFPVTLCIRHTEITDQKTEVQFGGFRETTYYRFVEPEEDFLRRAVLDGLSRVPSLR